MYGADDCNQAEAWLPKTWRDPPPAFRQVAVVRAACTEPTTATRLKPGCRKPGPSSRWSEEGGPFDRAGCPTAHVYRHREDPASWCTRSRRGRRGRRAGGSARRLGLGLVSQQLVVVCELPQRV